MAPIKPVLYKNEEDIVGFLKSELKIIISPEEKEGILIKS